ncbi:MAG: hypothetical protein J3K34DRAFT_196150 [Monoraphidium minutum]|nr:MAG: hypothetical protein J3K34DRAFT_196150 [Monoraphidium minutum]
MCRARVTPAREVPCAPGGCEGCTGSPDGSGAGGKGLPGATGIADTARRVPPASPARCPRVCNCFEPAPTCSASCIPPVDQYTRRASTPRTRRPLPRPTLHMRGAAARAAPPPAREENRCLAQALAARKPLILFFKSESCSLCRELLGDAADLEAARGVTVRTISTDDHASWAPEMLQYGVEAVPCFVALDAAGRAIAKTGAPRGAQHMRRSLDALARILKPQ